VGEACTRRSGSTYLVDVSDIDSLTARFEITVENLIHSSFDLQANESDYQAWYAASVIAEFGMSRVYREVHLMRTQLAELVSPETLVGFEKEAIARYGDVNDPNLAEMVSLAKKALDELVEP